MVAEEFILLMSEILESLYGALVVNAEGNVVYINRRYAEILGVDRNEVIGLPVEEVVPRTRMRVVLKTGQDEIGSVFEMKNGKTIVCNRIPIRNNGQVVGAVAFSTFTKIDELATFVKQVQRLHLELDWAKKELGKLRGAKYSIEQLVGQTADILKLKALAQKVAQTRSTVLITGETGTGKELFAHAIHQLSPRNHYPFIRLNCAAIPPDLLESELFGYEEGAFTGAKKGGKIGKFEQAHAGTLLLDEINQLPMNLQSKLLRVIQEKEIERIGAIQPTEVDVRLICTTNQDLYELVNKGLFREDLYYRINVVELNIPPLRERMDDLPSLIDFCVAKINKDLGLNIEGIHPEVKALLQFHNWPGNVRELDHALERASNMALSGLLMLEHFDFLELRMHGKKTADDVDQDFSLESVRNKAEKEAIRVALTKAGGNKSVAADLLKIDRSVLYDKTKKHGISL